MVVLPNHMRKFMNAIRPRVPPTVARKRIGACVRPIAHQTAVYRARCRRTDAKNSIAKRGGHNQVRQIDDGFEKPKAVKMQAGIREPCRQQQRKEYLRNKAEDPDQNGVAEVIGQICLKQLRIIVKARKNRSNNIQPGGEIFKEAVINRGNQAE